MPVGASLDRIRPAWGDEGRGALWLALGIGATFALGLALQLIGLRTLEAGDYATFVLGLSLGNVASALAAAIQPVVAVRATGGDPAFLPFAAGPTLLVATVATVAGAALLTPGVGWAVALLACFQVPIHALLGIGTGRLQAQRAFAAIAASLVLLSTVRIALVAPAARDGAASALVFAVALPLALLAAIGVIAWRGGFQGVPRSAAADGRRLLGQYALWALTAWLINGDAVYARLRLPADEAGAYALAFTLGRQPLYAVAPLTMVLLPVTLASHPAEQRGRLRAILVVSALLTLGTVALLMPFPAEIVRLLTGDEANGDPLLIRGYALIGSLAAAATLLLTFAFALGRSPRLPLLAALAVASGAAALAAGSPTTLLAIQAATVVALTAACWTAARASVAASVQPRTTPVPPPGAGTEVRNR